MKTYFTTLDWLVLLAYFLAILIIGFRFHQRNRTSEDFTAGGRSLPGWLCGLSIFATFLSSISYLALPGESFVKNWNAFVFSLTLPPTAFLASRWFLPYYRSTGEVSAYAMLEHRFGSWARIFASSFYLLFQIARMGVVMYLMALPMTVIFGWDMRLVILLTGVAVTFYAFFGGIIAVIWADATQAIVLIAGALIATAVLLVKMPGGAEGAFDIASRADKFSLGSWSLFSISERTVWVMFAYGIAENIKNFGIDQSYIQRYIASSSEREARRSIWFAGLLYIPISALFFFIGSTLYAYYESNPNQLREVREIVAHQKLMQSGVEASTASDAEGNVVWSDAYQSRLDAEAATLEDSQIGDRVFPHFIASQLAPGITGLLIAAIFAAAMSTVSTSLNSSATLVMSDFYQRFLRPAATEFQLMRCLRLATIAWGIFGTAMALALIPLTQNALDTWWKLSSILGAGIVGLFLLGLISRRVTNGNAIFAVVVGMTVVLWMVVSPTEAWPSALDSLRSPFESRLVIVVGTLLIVMTGVLLSRISPRSKQSN